ncbi:MAG: zinc-ribbon domain-containing protein [Clostridiales bacterium]|nr:zinc-ribbon domain-containing protein [Clostridiales bacterium]
MSFCIKCGTELAPNALFCHNCGEKVQVQAQSKVYSVYMRSGNEVNATAQPKQVEEQPQQAVEQPQQAVEQPEQVVEQPQQDAYQPQMQQPDSQVMVTPAMQAGKAKFCTHCGSLIDEHAVVCVKCGCNTDEKNTPVRKKFNGLAIAGFVLSFFDWFCFLGLIFSIIALVVINKKDQRGKGLAIAGIVISASSLPVTVFMAWVYLALLFGL